MHRPTKRLTRIVACAAVVPAVLVVAGCSSDSGSDKGGADQASKESKASASTAGDAAKKVQAATYKSLPQACGVFSKATLKDLVPKGDSKAGSSDDESTRANCSWSSLDNNGVKGSQFRWLNVSLIRFDSDANRGSGNDLASDYYAKQVKDAQASDGAKNVKTSKVSGTGDEATLVRYDSTYKEKKKSVTSKQQTVVTRVDNVVVTVNYNGSGLAGEKTPDADDLSKDAEKAAREAVASVEKTVSGSASGSGESASPSPSASKSSSKPSAKDTSKSASPSASKSASKKD
ncbi:DUF3558 domain-containing protein [Streptomyces sp. VRA16 Mangrove soil]|uniref:DUF3558 domain-containing protein n=1 Tax=Streptomyces sp. VRA16 Mangrove soil TaxID=2817434 RepID=UPI001A9CD952|nr:DUF3558 domain-containing protein [Streptomyces sp. VRA16 Mangrove soil]MBO1337827.1 DUF3558 domain-containing protein [Streptomyces sp. VRA16 Mangrove soil]